MNKKYLQTLVALAVLAGLWGIFTYVGRKKPAASSEKKSAPSQKIFPAKKDQIVAFTVTPSGGKPVTCTLNNKTWQITEPEKLPADSSTIDSFLGSLTSATPSEVVSEQPGDLKEFGLDPPDTTIEVKTNATPQEFTLRLGSSTPTNDGIYAQVAGQQRVFTLASFLKGSLEKNLFDFRNKEGDHSYLRQHPAHRGFFQQGPLSACEERRRHLGPDAAAGGPCRQLCRGKPGG